MEGKKVIFYAFLFGALLIGVFLPGYMTLRGLREQNEDAEKRIMMLQQHNEMLKEEITRMKQDPDYVEKKAREKLGIVKEGEYIYRGSE